MSSAALELEEIETGLLLEAIHRRYGYDFSGYARETLERRLKRRIQGESVRTLSQLQGRLLRDPLVMERLLEDLTVRVTAMFRDPGFFAALRRLVFPRLHTYPFVRVWNAGCATGEETWSLALMLLEAGLLERTRIYATDLSEEALERAREGAFPLARMRDFTAAYIAAGGAAAFSDYYRVEGDRARFDPSLGAGIVFARHNLVSDGPFNEFDLVVCRNVLIYFGRELQARSLALFDDSLRPLGVLGLGNQESLAGSPLRERYMQIEDGAPVYRKRGR